VSVIAGVDEFGCRERADVCGVFGWTHLMRLIERVLKECPQW
jgi:hypothetical protein